MKRIRTDHVHYIGLFASPVSWAKVNREFVRALDRTGLTVSATPQRGLHHQSDFEISSRLEKIFGRSRNADVEIMMDHPNNFDRLEGKLNLAWVLYETDLPEPWVERYRNLVDVYLCPSSFVRNRAIQAGLNEDRLWHVPFGVNPDVYKSKEEAGSGEVNEPLQFLFVGPQHRRKGVLELMEAYTDRFSAEDRVRLVVKTHPAASDNTTYPWEVDLVSRIEDRTGKQVPEIRLITRSLSENEMAELYRRSDLYVLPSYGEAFGLGVLESLACGTPVAVTEHPALKELVTTACGWFIDGRWREVADVAYDQSGECPFFVPDTDSIGEVLRRVYEDPDVLREAGENAETRASRFPWQHGAEAFKEKLMDESRHP